mgnify:CR=1 FL=1
MHIGFGSTPSRSTMIIKPLNISGFFCFFKLLFFPHFISQFHQKSYIKICSSIWIELFYIIVRCNRSCTGNVFTMISQHVRVEVNLVLSSGNNGRIFHEKVQDFFTNKRGRYLSGETSPEFE